MHEHLLKFPQLLLIEPSHILRTQAIACICPAKDSNELIAYILSQQIPLIINFPFNLLLPDALPHLLLKEQLGIPHHHNGPILLLH